MAMRRAPRIWEQKLEKMIRSAGVAGLGAASSAVIGPPPVPGPDAGGSEPAPPPVVDPAPETPRIPSTPVVAGTTLGLTVIWDGKDTAGILFPSGTTVQVHVSGSTGFTPSSATLKGVIAEPGGSLLVGGISAGATFYVRFIAVFPDGELSDPSAEGSAMVGLVQGPEINGDAVITQIVAATTPVTTYKLGSIWINTSNGTYNVLESVGGTPTWVKREWDRDAIAVNAISANQIAAQAITSKFLTGEIIRTGSSPSARIEISAANGIEVFRDATNKTFWAKPSGEVVFGTTSVSSGGTTVIDGGSITTGVINADLITAGTITGRVFRTAPSGQRVVMADATATYGASAIHFYSGVTGTFQGAIYPDPTFGIVVSNKLWIGDTLFANGTIGSSSRIFTSANMECDNMISVSLNTSGADVEFPGVYANNTTGEAPVGITTAGRLRRNGSSTQRIKYDISTLVGELSQSVDEARQVEVTTCDPKSILDVAVVEFSVIDQGLPTERRLLGVIAEDVDAKLPIAVIREADGTPHGVNDQAMIAALLAVVKDQQATIADLTARVEALES